VLVFYAVMAGRISVLPNYMTVPMPARVIALISLSCWCAVIAAGRLITFYRPPEFWCFWC
jgi:hypothetical protein